MDMLSWGAQAGQLVTTSGSYHMSCMPNRALIFMTPQNVDSDLVNPFNFEPHQVTEAIVTCDGLEYNMQVHHARCIIAQPSFNITHQLQIDMDKRSGMNVYGAMVRAMAPTNGMFAIPDRFIMGNGLFIICIDLTRSTSLLSQLPCLNCSILGGKFGTTVVDVPELKSPSILSVSTRHLLKFEKDMTIHCVFLSSARINIEKDEMTVEYL